MQGSWVDEAEPAEVPAPSFELPDLSWLLPGVARRQMLDEMSHHREMKREARQAKRAAAAAAEQKYDQAVGNYLAEAAMRGEVVSAMHVATGKIGRTISDVLDDVRELVDRVPKEHREPVNYIGGAPARRSGWPQSEYEVDRLLRRTDELHRDRIAYMARHNYPAAMDAARAKQEAVRSADYFAREIYR